jgi:hypothetical protein
VRRVSWVLALAALAPRPSCAATGDAAPAFAATAVSASSTTDAAARYKSEGPVVDNAASFIGVMTVIPSAVVGAVACPVVLAGNKAAPSGTYQQRYKDCVSAGASKGSQLFYTVGGYPFMVLKRVFWDMPIRVFSSSDAPKKTKPVDPGR